MQLPYRKPKKFSHIQNDPFMTQKKFNTLSTQLNRLKKQRPKAVSEVMRLAELGDFSENMEYQQAKGYLRRINNQILILEQQINKAKIILYKSTTHTVEVGAIVTITNGKILKTYQILGSSETNPGKGIISHISPIGAALLGHRIGDTITITIKKIDYTYTITQIL